MNRKAIRDRRPTKADATPDGYVLVWADEQWNCCHWAYDRIARENLPWKPIDQTPPPEPEPEKSKRRRIKSHVGGGFASEIESLEILPGDPPDLDALLEAVDDLLDFDPHAFQALRKARHGEGDEGMGKLSDHAVLQMEQAAEICRIIIDQLDPLNDYCEGRE